MRGGNRLFYEGISYTVAIMLIGTINLYSALHRADGLDPLFYRHLVWLAAGIAGAFVLQFINSSDIEYTSRFSYAVCCLLLVLVMVAGKKVYGAQRWLGFGPFQFQPSEVIKLFMIFFLARWFKDIPVVDGGYRIGTLTLPLLLVALPVVLILKQPDLGTAIVVLSIALLMMLLLGVNRRLLGTAAGLLVAAMPVLWFFLKDYQRRRLTSFLSPESDPMGAGYQSLQAKIAISNGGFTGAGYLKAAQSRLGFLPEKHTDFVFSVFAEEWGLAGVATVIILYCFFLHWMFKTVRNIHDRFLFLSGAGVVFLFSLHLVINLAMVSGLFPVVGVPLPLLSYGGTALAVNLMAVGFLLKLSRSN